MDVEDDIDDDDDDDDGDTGCCQTPTRTHHRGTFSFVSTASATGPTIPRGWRQYQYLLTPATDRVS